MLPFMSKLKQRSTSVLSQPLAYFVRNHCGVYYMNCASKQAAMHLAEIVLLISIASSTSSKFHLDALPQVKTRGFIIPR